MRAGVATALALGGGLAAAALAVMGGAPSYAPTEAAKSDVAKAEAYLAAHHEALPEGWRWGEVEAEAGALRTGFAGLGDEAPVILFVPGYSGTIELYSEFYAAWRARGYGVYAVDLPGQGGSVRRGDNPEKPFTGDFSLYGDAVRRAAADLRRRTEGPVVMVAESFGGQAALRAAADGPLDVDALVLEVPGLAAKTPGLPRPLALGMAHGLTALGFGGAYAPMQGQWAPRWVLPEGPSLCGDREDRVFLQTALFTLRPELRVAGVTNEWFSGFARSGGALARGDGLEDLTIPVTAVIAGQDGIVLNAPTERLCDEVLEDCRLVRIEEASHCLVYEEDAVTARFFAAVDEAVRALPKAPS